MQYFISGPSASITTNNKDCVEPLIDALCFATGDLSEDYTSTYIAPGILNLKTAKIEELKELRSGDKVKLDGVTFVVDSFDSDHGEPIVFKSGFWFIRRSDTMYIYGKTPTGKSASFYSLKELMDCIKNKEYEIDTPDY